jgi:hypothetical protein
MVLILKPPAPLRLDPGAASVFLAGSIEMGTADDWQRQVEAALHDLPVVILNPRRDEWDASWVQSISNPQFREQVEWELEAQERARVIAMYFAPPTRAPITLLELGLFARSGKLLVCCPEGFWRKGNVEVVCARYGVPLVAELAELVRLVRERVRSGRT